MEIKYKQYVIIPKKPKMSVGKIASQVAHSTFMALENQKVSDGDRTLKQTMKLLSNWRHNGMCVIVLECKDAMQLLGIAKYLDQWKIPNHLYIDEGLTEVDMGTPTSLATGVMSEETHWMLSQLKLY